MNNNSYTPNSGVTAPIDPGWNDPPKLTFNTQQSTPNRPRNILNKRVAFPMSKTMSSPEAPSPVNHPPMPIQLPTASLNHVTSNTQPEEILTDSDKILVEVKEILLNLLETSTELGPKTNDIKRRIDIMEEMWIIGKLNNTIFLRMRDLAYALRDDLPSQADAIHRSLMVDHVSAVGTWMPGVKQLIHNCIARSELLAIDKE